MRKRVFCLIRSMLIPMSIIYSWPIVFGWRLFFLPVSVHQFKPFFPFMVRWQFQWQKHEWTRVDYSVGFSEQWPNCPYKILAQGKRHRPKWSIVGCCNKILNRPHRRHMHVKCKSSQCQISGFGPAVGGSHVFSFLIYGRWPLDEQQKNE